MTGPPGPLLVLDAPSNLGLRPPEEGSVPGCYKAPWALREHGLVARVGAADGGCVVPPRYRAAWTPGEGDRNGDAIASYTRALAERMAAPLDVGQRVLVLGGDCSILTGAALALRRRGRFGLVYVDAHSDFRHQGNAPAIGAAGGEALAIVTGRGDERLVCLYDSGPLVRAEDAFLVGVREVDDLLDEIGEVGIGVATARRLVDRGSERVAAEVLQRVQAETDGFWVHFDVDVVDAGEIDAVDCPEPGGPSLQQIAGLLRALAAAPGFVGMEVTIFDPDLDPSGLQAGRVVTVLETMLGDGGA
jgi:arginase